MRSLRILMRLLPRLARQYDLAFVGFYGYLLMLPVGALSRRPILFDAFVSNYDTLCFDRARFLPNSLPGHLAFWLDRTTCQRADRVLLDTTLHADYFAKTFGLPPSKFHVLPVGCNEDLFHPHPLSVSPDGMTRVLYYSSYLPLHGVETVVHAATLLQSESRIHFRLIGHGQEYTAVRELAADLKNVTFVPPCPLDALPAEIASADICLGGHWGRSAKGGRVVPGKVYQMLAMARPVIAADTAANQTLLSHQVTAYLCPPNEPEALAAAILRLHNDVELRNYLAANGRNLYATRCSEAVITERLGVLVHEMIDQDTLGKA